MNEIRSRERRRYRQNVNKRKGNIVNERIENNVNKQKGNVMNERKGNNVNERRGIERS